MGKRKRDLVERGETSTVLQKDSKNKKTSNLQHPKATTVTVQVIVGTYEKVLHGVQATLFEQAKGAPGQGSFVEFADTFLLSPHSSAIRCLAISPPSNSDTAKSQKAILASGSSDQVVNLYHISIEAPPRHSEGPQLPTLVEKKITENSRNRELGSLQHHGGSVNALRFPTRSKLLSAADDNTIAVARTRDWTVLSTIKVPIPKAHGRPSGDTAPLGSTPAGVTDFAIHPSMKLMVSVGKGEKCMRLWNLVTGKKAGVLNFERDLLQGVGEGRWASGEGRKVEWNSLGEEFVVAFERGCVVFGMDCKPKFRVIPSPSTKIHQLRYIAPTGEGHDTIEMLAVSTEDGRLLFYSTSLPVNAGTSNVTSKPDTPVCEAIGQLGGIAEGLASRIKDFEILQSPHSKNRIIVAGSSDGAIRLWKLDGTDLRRKPLKHEESSETEVGSPANGHTTAPLPQTQQVGQLLGTYEAGNRITCLTAFVMIEPGDLETNGLRTSTALNKANRLDVEDEISISS